MKTSEHTSIKINRGEQDNKACMTQTNTATVDIWTKRPWTRHTKRSEHRHNHSVLVEQLITEA